jgi:uncharacterized protein (DUF2062 family)
MARHLLRRLTRRLEPFVADIVGHPWVRTYAPRLADPDLWHLNRRSTARAVAVGLFSGLIPGPFQVIGSVLLSIGLRANFPLAAITTLYTNPFTIVPLYLVAYEYGTLFVHGAGHAIPRPPPDFVWSTEYFHLVVAWMGQLGKPLAVGVLMLALTLALVGWIVVRVGWRCHAVWAWRRRARLRAARLA